MRFQEWKGLVRQTLPYLAAAGGHVLLFALFFLMPRSPSPAARQEPFVISLKTLVLPDPDPKPESQEPETSTLPENLTEQQIQPKSVRPEKPKHSPDIEPDFEHAEARTQPDTSGQKASAGPAEVTALGDNESQAPRSGALPPIASQGPPSSEEKARNTLQALSCLRLNQTDYRPECDEHQKSNHTGQFALTAPDGWQNVELGPNPYETALDRFSQRQNESRATPYSQYQAKSSDHQHANPFSGSQSSAERDLTGNVNAFPDPVWGD